MRHLALLLLVVTGACSPSPGQESPLGAVTIRPTVVSLNPCADAILVEVADPEQLLAISHYSRDPASSSMDVAKAQRLRATSGSVEEIAALRPDVVVAGTFLPPASAQALKDLGIRVVQVGIADSVAQSETQVRQLAALTGNREAGEFLAGRMERALADAAPADGGKPVPAIVWQSGGIVAGDNSLIADLLRRTGFENAAAARGLKQADYIPLEAMVAHPPEVLFSAGSSHSEEDRMLAHPALQALKGTRRAQFESSLLWCGGPTIIRAAARLAEVRNGLGDREIIP